MQRNAAARPAVLKPSFYDDATNKEVNTGENNIHKYNLKCPKY